MVYKLKAEYQHFSRDLQEDLWIMISFLKNSEDFFDKKTGEAFLKKYYNEPE